MDRSKKRRWLGAGARRLGAATLLTLVPQSAWAQCAMCARALQSEEGRQMISAFRSGILLMLVAPFALVGIIGTLAVRRFRIISLSSTEAADAADKVRPQLNAHSVRSAVDGSTADARWAGTTLASAATASSVTMAAVHATGSTKLTR